MLVNWKKDCVIVLPKLKHFGRTVKLLPGVNEINNEYWAACKHHRSVANHIANGMIAEIAPVTKTKEATEADKVATEKRKKAEMLKEEKKATEKELKKARSKEDKNKLQEELDGISADIEITEQEAAEEEAKVFDQTSNFSKLGHAQKQDLINECFDIDTLNSWLDTDSKAEVRNLILSRIDLLKKKG